MNKEKVKYEDLKVWDNSEEVKKALQTVADNLKLPINDHRVLRDWVADGKRSAPHVFDEVFIPLYFSKYVPHFNKSSLD